METRQPMINRRHALLLARARTFARDRARLARERAHQIARAIRPRIRALPHQHPSARPLTRAHTHSPPRGPQQSPSRRQLPMCARRHVRRRARSLPPHRHQSCALRQSGRRALHRARCCEREMRYSVDDGARTLFLDTLHAALRETAREPYALRRSHRASRRRRIRLHNRPVAVHHKYLIYEPSLHGTA
jgi:hypothetical protein